MRILLVEDDEKLCSSLAFQLKKEGYAVDTCSDGCDALYEIEQNIHDILLLDRMLPGLDGITLLQRIRTNGNHVPVILLTALGELENRITGLDAGADDYLVKPFAFQELLARIRCIVRRPRQWNAGDALEYGDIRLQLQESLLSCREKHCTLSRKECCLLECFMRNHNQTLPRATLLNKVWGPDSEIEDGNLDNYIHFLRRRLKSVHSGTTVKTIRGIGYSLESS